MRSQKIVQHLDINHNHEAGLIPISTTMLLRDTAEYIDKLHRMIGELAVQEGVKVPPIETV